jgi:hypothetical protein
MESNDEDTLWSVEETPPQKRRRVGYDHLYGRLETQQVAPLSIQNYSYSEFVEENDCTGNEQSMSYYWNDQTTLSNAEGAFLNLEAIGTYLHCLAKYYPRAQILKVHAHRHLPCQARQNFNVSRTASRRNIWKTRSFQLRSIAYRDIRVQTLAMIRK